MLRNTLIILTLLFGLFTQAQNATLGYRIEGDVVVFTFDPRDYYEATEDGTHDRLDFEDLEIYKVSVSGQFNNWSREGWVMKKLDTNTFELRKKLADFTDEFSWEFKFIVNNRYWAEPSDDKASNLADAKEGNQWLHVYNLKLYTAQIDDEGNVDFHLPGYTDAHEVILAGSFNKWNEHAFKMKKIEGGWKLTLSLKPDVYQYKFIVDGHWMHDPHNPEKVINEFDTYNSVAVVTGKVTFTLEGFNDAEKVVLAGSFNDWNEESMTMTHMDGKWLYTLDLPGGKHHYKFIVDGKWMTDPQNPVKEYDYKGNINSVKMVQ